MLFLHPYLLRKVIKKKNNLYLKIRFVIIILRVVDCSILNNSILMSIDYCSLLWGCVRVWYVW